MATNLNFNPYDVLGLPVTASSEDIKAAYRNLARRLHPDSNPNNPGAAKQFQDITVAYEILHDALRRSSYDREAQTLSANGDLRFSLRTTPSKRRLARIDEPQVIYLHTELFTDPAAENRKEKNESHLNITLVLDRSKSMDGTRMEKVKVAAHQIIDNLRERDIISIVTFNDRADVIIPATYAKDKPALKARVSMISAMGGTEIFQGLNAGVNQNRTYFGPKLVNHVILLTDGHTYGDQEQSLELASAAGKEGIGISAMGLGSDWNDEFLDQLASSTGGNSVYIRTANEVSRYMNDQVRHLSNAFAERMHMVIAPDADIQIEMAFKLAPQPQPLKVENGEIKLGSLQFNRPIGLLLQLLLPANMPLGFRSLARLVTIGDVLQNKKQSQQAISDLTLEVVENTPGEDPPTSILDALSKLTLYRLQERANDALEQGDIVEATRRLENLATRLLEMGETELANETLSEARRVAHTAGLSDRGRKTLKYQTRYLVASTTDDNND